MVFFFFPSLHVLNLMEMLDTQKLFKQLKVVVPNSLLGIQGLVSQAEDSFSTDPGWVMVWG